MFSELLTFFLFITTYRIQIQDPIGLVNSGKGVSERNEWAARMVNRNTRNC